MSRNTARSPIRANYSHDNGDGFMLLCTDDQPHTAEIVFNLNVHDAYVLHDSPCKIASGQGTTIANGQNQDYFDHLVSASNPTIGFLCCSMSLII